MSKLGKTETAKSYSNRWLRIGYAGAKADTVFSSLMCHINVETLKQAYDCMDATKAVGTDGMNKKTYGIRLEENLKNLAERIHIGSYKPQVKREVLIPKANGKMRPLAISCFEDKLVEWVIGKILTSMYEPMFISTSFGFRENRSAHGAIGTIYNSLKDNERPHVVEIDFASFFNSIPHRKLMKILSKRINDNRFKGLIGRFLTVGIMKESGTCETPAEGTPQGSIMSPVLANIFLDEVLDKWFKAQWASKANVIVRYADDAVFFFESEDTAKKFVLELGKRIELYDLKLNEEKTNIITFDRKNQNTFDFLGFTFYWDKLRHGKQALKVKTQQKTLHKKIQEFDLWIKTTRSRMKLKVIWKLAKAKLAGHYNYFGYAENLPKLNHFYAEVVRSMYKWLNRRSQKRSYNWETFKQKLSMTPLGEPPPMEQLRRLRLGWAYV